MDQFPSALHWICPDSPLSLYFLHGIEVTRSENLIFLVRMMSNGIQKSFFMGRQFLTQPVRWPRQIRKERLDSK